MATVTAAQLDTINECMHDLVVRFDYPGSTENTDVNRTLVFKYLKLNKRGEVYLQCVERLRGSEACERVKNFSLGLIKNFCLASFLDKLRVWFKDAWQTVQGFVALRLQSVFKA